MFNLLSLSKCSIYCPRAGVQFTVPEHVDNAYLQLVPQVFDALIFNYRFNMAFRMTAQSQNASCKTDITPHVNFLRIPYNCEALEFRFLFKFYCFSLQIYHDCFRHL